MSKRTKRKCRAQAITGSPTCRFHGGYARRGLASPSYKTGKHSKYLPTRLLEHYQTAIADSELLALREDIALIDARLVDLLQRVDTGESGSLWQHLQQISKKLLAAQANQDSVATTNSITELTELIQQGSSDYQIWREINKLLEQRRKQAESERKRLLDMQQYVSVEQAMILVSGLINSCKTHVKDPKSLAAISQDIARLTTFSASSPNPSVNGDLMS